YERDYLTPPIVVRDGTEVFRTQEELEAHVVELQGRMRAAAANLDFEKAAAIRDDIKRLRNADLGLPWPARRASAGVFTYVSARLRREAREVQNSARLPRSTSPAASTRPFYRHDVIEQLDAIGFGSLAVVGLAGLFTGAALTLQSGMTLDQYGARPVVG